MQSLYTFSLLSLLAQAAFPLLLPGPAAQSAMFPSPPAGKRKTTGPLPIKKSSQTLGFLPEGKEDRILGSLFILIIINNVEKNKFLPGHRD
jgi:hypothetical protein